MRRYARVGFSVARRTASARRPAGMGGPAGPAVIGDPAAGCELSVPAQDRGWRNEKTDPAVAGESVDESGDQCPVGPGDSSSPGLAVQYGELVAQHEDLDVLVRVGAGEQHHPAQQPGHDQVRQSERHQAIMPSRGGCRTRRSRSSAEFRAPTRWAEVRTGHSARICRRFCSTRSSLGGNSSTIDPWSMTRHRSARPATMSRSCSIRSTPAPDCSAYERRTRDMA
jgi:hypothetical protein